MGAPVLLALETCVACDDTRGAAIHVRTVRGFLCGYCWVGAGMPGAPDAAEPLETQAAREARVRDRMAKRSGQDRNLLRKGRT